MWIFIRNIRSFSKRSRTLKFVCKLQDLQHTGCKHHRALKSFNLSWKQIRKLARKKGKNDLPRDGWADYVGFCSAKSSLDIGEVKILERCLRQHINHLPVEYTHMYIYPKMCICIGGKRTRFFFCIRYLYSLWRRVSVYLFKYLSPGFCFHQDEFKELISITLPADKGWGIAHHLASGWWP